jgi:hypothetical protein
MKWKETIQNDKGVKDKVNTTITTKKEIISKKY